VLPSRERAVTWRDGAARREVRIMEPMLPVAWRMSVGFVSYKTEERAYAYEDDFCQRHFVDFSCSGV
jgi:hypothetical protein